jgi:hypothetical protein
VDINNYNYRVVVISAIGTQYSPVISITIHLCEALTGLQIHKTLVFNKKTGFFFEIDT